MRHNDPGAWYRVSDLLDLLDDNRFLSKVPALLNCKTLLVNVSLIKAALVAYLKEYIDPKDIRRGLIAFDIVSKQQGTYSDATIKLNYGTVDAALRLTGKVLAP